MQSKSEIIPDDSPTVSLHSTRKLFSAGAGPGLQNRRMVQYTIGGFDPHELPPVNWRLSIRRLKVRNAPLRSFKRDGKSVGALLKCRPAHLRRCRVGCVGAI